MNSIKRLKTGAIEKSDKRKFGLDLIRAIAICLVLISHSAKKFEYLGFWGVELFFGLSGFLIGHILWKAFSQTNSWSGSYIINFWSRRWWRTLPNYYLFCLISLLFHYFFDGILPSFSELSDFFWFGQDLLKHNGGFYGVSWSLCIEEWFYISFPIVLLLFVKIGFKEKSFVVSIVAIFVFSIVLRYLLIQEGIAGDLRMVTLARLDAIAGGVLIAYLTSVFNMSSKHKIFLLGCGLLFMSSPVIYSFFYDMSYERIISNTYFLLIVPLGGSLILPYFSSLNQPRGIFMPFSKSIEKISLWSYSIYLSHIPILFTTYSVMNYFRDTIHGNIASKIIGLILTVCFSAFLFNFFELPLMKKRPRELLMRKKPVMYDASAT